MKGRENKCTRVLSIHTAIVSGVSELGESCDASAATELLQRNSMSRTNRRVWAGVARLKAPGANHIDRIVHRMCVTNRATIEK